MRPIGIQGGLTGALFREFAFTLAGAVIVSGIVALTLSPMMASKLLRAGATERGFAGIVNRRFESVRAAVRAHLGGTLQYRPVVFALWAIVVAADGSVLHVLAAGTCARRGSGRRVRRHPGLAQLHPRSDRTCSPTRCTTCIKSFPESQSIFQITTPTGGFGGMVTKPWSERKKTAQQLLLESAGPLSNIAGIRVIPLTPPASAGRRKLPGRFRDRVAG